MKRHFTGINDQLEVMILPFIVCHQLLSKTKPNQFIMIELMGYGYFKKKLPRLMPKKLLELEKHSPLQQECVD